MRRVHVPFSVGEENGTKKTVEELTNAEVPDRSGLSYVYLSDDFFQNATKLMILLQGSGAVR